MPVIKVQSVSTFSSEDVKHPASNLLSSDTYRKWKCASAAEKKAVVVLQLQTPVQIHSMDIGNEGSAFVEVLVSRSSSADDYKVLLVASTFMTPSDSKGWKNTNRVRMFGPEKLSKDVREQKWDTVKVVCTQPYNKREQYGLSFLTLHSPPDHSPEATTTPTKPKLGAFSLKEEPKALPTGSLFYKKDSSPQSVSGVSGITGVSGVSMAAQARSATTAALSSPTTSRAGGDSAGRKERKGKRKEGEKISKKKPAADQTTAKVSSAKDNKPMSGVVFSLSGFQNPFRTELREKMMEMGASFQPDWSTSCTHLVCAFPNTPKYNQVKESGGLIVKKQWVLDSHVKNKRLPASKYRLSGGGGGSSSEDEEYDKRERDMFGEVVVGAKRSREQMETQQKKEEEEEGPYAGSTDDEEMETDVVTRKPAPDSRQSSECDTEDEIQRIKAGQDEYGGTTETDSDTSGERGRTLGNLPDLFLRRHFMLHGFPAADRRLVRRYIVAYSGIVEEYMSEAVAYVVTSRGWDGDFDQALEDNSSLVFVRPQWIFKCHEKQSLVPYQPYVVVPS